VGGWLAGSAGNKAISAMPAEVGLGLILAISEIEFAHEYK